MPSLTQSRQAGCALCISAWELEGTFEAREATSGCFLHSGQPSLAGRDGPLALATRNQSLHLYLNSGPVMPVFLLMATEITHY